MGLEPVRCRDHTMSGAAPHISGDELTIEAVQTRLHPEEGAVPPKHEPKPLKPHNARATTGVPKPPPVQHHKPLQPIYTKPGDLATPKTTATATPTPLTPAQTKPTPTATAIPPATPTAAATPTPTNSQPSGNGAAPTSAKPTTPPKLNPKLSWYDKASLLPKYQHTPQAPRRNALGQFAPGKNGKYAPVLPGLYSRYGGSDLPTKTFNTNGSADPRNWTQTRNYQKKDDPPKINTTFARVATGGTQQFFGGGNTDPNSPLNYRYGAWGTGVASASVDRTGVKAQVAGEIKIGGEATLKGTLFKTGPVRVDAGGTVFGGARLAGGADVTITKDKVTAGAQASAFAGVEARGNLKTTAMVDGHDVGNVDVSGGVTAGIGGQVEVTAGYDHGKVRIAAGGKFAVGLGLSFKVDTTIDVPQIAQVAKDEAVNVVHFLTHPHLP